MGKARVPWHTMARSTTRAAALVTLASALTWAVACGTVDPPASGQAGAPSRDETSVAHPSLRVVSLFYPLAELTKAVTGGDAQVLNLTPAGVEPHDYELTARDVEALREADLVVYPGPGYAPGFDAALRQVPPAAVLDVREGADLLPAPAGEKAMTADPHLWLSPASSGHVVRRIRDALSHLDPAHRERYRQNAERMLAQLAELDRAYRQGLAQCRVRQVVVPHRAFAYLERDYGIQQIPVFAGLAPDQEPGPQRLAQLVELVRRERLPVVFTESAAAPDPTVEAIARETGAAVRVLSVMEVLSKEEQLLGYTGLLERNLANLREAMGCS
ncbi:MAG: zinc ABC transporter substrate-binding protein [Clostridia bacterium]|nr:zinc ABC transporter substrate-binding protein [Clostridia bacterium]